MKEAYHQVQYILWIDLTDSFVVFSFIFPPLGMSQRYGFLFEEIIEPVGSFLEIVVAITCCDRICNNTDNDACGFFGA